MTDHNIDHEIECLITPPRRDTLAASIAAQIKSLIFRKKIKPGERLPSERELARMFKVSRVVVKQAILALEHSGFVETKLGAKGGAFVKFNLSKPIMTIMEDLQQNSDIRISHFQNVRKALEIAALENSLDRNIKLDLTHLREINEAFIKPENHIRHSELNFAFHKTLAGFSGNPIINLLLSAIMEIVFSYPGPTISTKFIEKAYRDHLKIIKAIEAQEKLKAIKYLTENINLISSEDI